MNLEIFFALLTIIYIYNISIIKNKRKLGIFLSKPLNILLILILILLVYLENKNIAILLFIILLFSKYYVRL